MTSSSSSSFGSNLGFVDELYADYLRDPSSVSESWQEFFADYKPSPGAFRVTAETPVPSVGGNGHGGNGAAAAAAGPEAVAAAQVQPPSAPATPVARVEERSTTGPRAEVEAETPEAAAEALPPLEPLRGISARIAENMVDSLTVPTATSTRTIAVKLLEENRRLLNQHQAATAGPKISFTHVIAWAVVRALGKHPAMLSSFAQPDSQPSRQPHTKINLGLAIDMEKRGERILLVPNVKDAGSLDFPHFVAAYSDLISRARQNKLELSDYEGTNVSLTNPGTVGTVLSVPRLMKNQGAIIGIGTINYPAEYRGMAPEVISELGLSKVMNVTSTYDHRVIQGAASGEFLASLEKLLLGEFDFYQQIFRQLGVPYEPVEWAGDQAPAILGHDGNAEAIRKQASVLQLIRAHRVRGHLWADLDPLGYHPQPNPELELSTYNLSVWDLDRSFIAGGLGGMAGRITLRRILDTLRETYCRHIGVEFMHIPEPEAREWLQARMEGTRNAEPFDSEAQHRILGQLNAAEALEAFLHRTYIGQKRFSLEGAETVLPMLAALLDDAADQGVQEAVIGMAHRGRLNVLANILGKPYGTIFREFEGDMDPEIPHGSGDVKYHVGARGKHTSASGHAMDLTLASNPSHLEAVDPVVQGMARARQQHLEDTERALVLPILIHGDAAFSGQGVVAETFSLSQLAGYSTGGTVHIVINNQIGFTAGPEELRSSLYATDIAKGVRAPIFHVNGDFPEDAIRVIRLALEFRQRFKRDAVVDLVCYRRWGHNEGDDPSYTQPQLYKKIQEHRSVRKLYTEQLLRRGDLDVDTAERALDDFQTKLREVHDEVRRAKGKVPPPVETERENIEGIASSTIVETAIDQATINLVVEGLQRVPDSFEPHPKLARQLSHRRERIEKDRVDWALGEALAFGTLLLEGHPVRLSGEDSSRGTFSQRHAVLHDHRSGEIYVPLAHLGDGQAPFEVHDSMLSEFAVLGFEYGYSVNSPHALVLWEAQFGDFANGAQVIMDQFISSAEDKWGQHSGVVMLLPHAFEGQGPEHSSARIERYLQLCAEGNLQVCYPSTPAQYFHLLRRQLKRPAPPKPLVIFTPKSLLRLPAAVSPAADITAGHFFEVLRDTSGGKPADAERLLLCSGKVYYDLAAARDEHELDNVHIVRLEQFYPFPAGQLRDLLGTYGHLDEIFWVQEEPRNMGGRDFLDEPIIELLEPHQKLRFVCRPSSASPATGSHKRHEAEQKDLVRRALGLVQ